MIDKALHKGLMKLLDEGTFPLQAKEVPAFIKIYNWAKDLDKEPPKVTKKKVKR